MMGIYLTQVGPISCGQAIPPLRSISPLICREPVRWRQPAGGAGRRVCPCYAIISHRLSREITWWDSRHHFRRRFLLSVQECDLMLVAFALQRKVAEPTVGVYNAASFHGVLHKRHEAVRRSVRYSPHPNAADARSILLSRNHNQRFALSLAATNAFLQTAQVRLVYFDSPR